MSVMDSTVVKKPMLTAFPAHASEGGAYMFMGLEEHAAEGGCCSGGMSYVCYSPDGAVRYRWAGGACPKAACAGGAWAPGCSFSWRGGAPPGCSRAVGLTCGHLPPVLRRIVKEGLFFESARVLDGEGALLASMDKNAMSLAKWSIKDARGRVVASTATVPGLAKYGVQLFLPGSSKPALMCAPTGDLRSLGVWQCGKRINRDEGQEYAEAAYGR